MNRHQLLEQWRETRERSLSLTTPLTIEDYSIQSFEDASPPKWHLAHTSWFFEEFILCRYMAGFKRNNPSWGYLFNSYYQSVGPFHERPRRGVLARPSIEEVWEYRRQVDDQLSSFIMECDNSMWAKIATIVEIGIQHEKQHQELLLTDIKANFYANPLYPAYAIKEAQQGSAQPLDWIPISEGIQLIGADADGFSYDNERPRHKFYMHPAMIANRPSTNREYLAFIEDGGYDRSEFWTSDGWHYLAKTKQTAPRYWQKNQDEWLRFSLFGMQDLPLEAPVSHINFYEADAFARWADARLPTEQEWEVFSADQDIAGNLNGLEPEPAAGKSQIFGDVWEWTSSSYSPYPGFTPMPGNLSEYNGKFMVNQYVLRGGSSASPLDHIRHTYRNFFYAHCNWQFSGVRLARNT